MFCTVPQLHTLFKEPITEPLKSKMADVIFFCRGWFDLDKISQTGAEWHVDCGDMVEIETGVEFQYGGRLGEFDGMLSQSHV